MRREKCARNEKILLNAKHLGHQSTEQPPFSLSLTTVTPENIMI